MERCYFGEGKLITIPKPRFVKEHTNLIKILREGDPKKLEKEAADQAKELKEMGGSKQSGFVARMLGEVKAKHDGVYKNPTAPIRKDTKMNKPVAFDYFSMPKDSREKSEFIMDHFFKIKPYKKGERETLNTTELKMLRDAEAERQRRSRANRKGGKRGEFLPAPTFKNPYVEAKKSKIHGRGLFAKVDIPKGTEIAEYQGVEMSWKDYKEKYGDDLRYSYLMRRVWKVIDGKGKKYLTKNPSHYLNEGKTANVELKNRKLYAKRNLKEGEELFLKYAKDYPRNW